MREYFKKLVFMFPCSFIDVSFSALPILLRQCWCISLVEVLCAISFVGRAERTKPNKRSDCPELTVQFSRGGEASN